jgi:hypothetical protein
MQGDSLGGNDVYLILRALNSGSICHAPVQNPDA